MGNIADDSSTFIAINYTNIRDRRCIGLQFEKKTWIKIHIKQFIKYLKIQYD